MHIIKLSGCKIYNLTDKNLLEANCYNKHILCIQRKLISKAQMTANH